MKNKALLAVIVIIAALTTAAWAADQHVIEDIAEQTAAGKTAPAEVPAEPQHLAAKPHAFTDAELKAYENNIIDRVQSFYVVGLTLMLFFLTIVATALFWTLEIYRKRKFEKITTDQLAKQRQTYEKTVQKAHDAIEKQGKEMQQQFDEMREEVYIKHAALVRQDAIGFRALSHFSSALTLDISSLYSLARVSDGEHFFERVATIKPDVNFMIKYGHTLPTDTLEVITGSLDLAEKRIRDKDYYQEGIAAMAEIRALLAQVTIKQPEEPSESKPSD